MEGIMEFHMHIPYQGVPCHEWCISNDPYGINSSFIVPKFGFINGLEFWKDHE